MKNILVITTSALWLLAALLTFTLRLGHADTKNGLCLTEPEFTNVNAMGETDAERLKTIRDWLDGLLPKSPKGAFLKGRNPDGTNYTFQDLDGISTDPAQEISNAAKNNKINPRVLLTTLRKEKPDVFRDSTRPREEDLMTLAGCGSSPTARQQIRCMGQKLKEWFYDQLSQCKATIGGWNVDLVKQTGDTPGQEKDASDNACSVEPESKAATALYQYTPWAGRRYLCGYGHPDYPEGVGGNGLFCRFWQQHGWQAPPGTLALSPQSPTLVCAPPTPTQPSRCSSINASGGDPGPNGYSWSTTKGVLTPPTGVNKHNIQLKPPDNPGRELPGTAYHLAGCSFQFGGDCFNQGGARCQEAQYGCNDQLRAGCGGFTAGCLLGCAPQTCDTCKAALAGQGYSFDDVLVTIDGADFFSGKPITTGCVPRTNPGLNICGDFLQLGIGRVIDKRTQSCRPCRLEMQGATVTVIDAAGASVSKTVTVK